MKSLSILIAVLFLQASLSEASTACDGVYSSCIETIDVFSVCWAGYYNHEVIKIIDIVSVV